MSGTHTGLGDNYSNTGFQNNNTGGGTQNNHFGPDEKATRVERCLSYMQQNRYVPKKQKTNAERCKERLFKPACEWIFKNSMFQQWHDGADPPSLWLHGGPGKGKTKLLCSVIDHLLEPTEEAPDPSDPSPLVTYSFFSDPDGDCEASFVVATLIHGLAKQHPSYLHRISKDYNYESKYPFQGKRSLNTLLGILEDMLKDNPARTKIILVVDALDECKPDTDLDQLLDLIHETSSIHVRWFVSSRGLETIHQKFDAPDTKMRKLSLDQTGKDIQQGVRAYVHHRMGSLHRLRMGDETKEKLQNQLLHKAEGTFLWLSIVMAEIRDVSSWDVGDVVDELPDDLESLYVKLLQNLLEGLEQSRSKNLVKELLYKALATTVAALRPLYIEELKELAGFPARICYNSQVEEIIDKCGAFLTCQNNQVFLIHLSAKEFLTPERLQSAFQPNSLDIQHHLVSRSISAMGENLKRDIYDLRDPGIAVDDIHSPPSPDPLSCLEYSCVHWVDHLEKVKEKDPSHNQAVRLFLEKSLLHWLEAMSLQRKMGEALRAVQKLCRLMQNTGDPELDTLTKDIDHFVQVHRETIENHPLQIYISALLFSPTDTWVRRLYEGEEPNWISLKPKRETTWSPRAKSLLMLAPPWSLAISTDGNLLAAISDPDWTDKEWEERYKSEWKWERGADYPHAPHPSSLLEIWDLNSYELIGRLGLDSMAFDLGFLRDGKRLALVGSLNRFEIWNAEKGSCLQTLQNPDEPDLHFTSLALSTSTHIDLNEDVIATGSDNGVVRLWNPATGNCTRSIWTPGERVSTLKFSQDGQKLAVGLGNGTVEVRDSRSGALIRKLEAHDDLIGSMAFLGNDQLVSTSEKDGIRILNLKTGGCIRTPHMKAAPMVVSLGSGGLFASATCLERTVRIWNNKGDSVQLFEGNEEGTNVLTFCPEQQLLAHATTHGVDIWDLKLFRFAESIPLHIEPVLSTTLSSDSLLLASGSNESIRIWNMADGTCTRSIDCAGAGGSRLAFSPNSRYLVSRGASDWPNSDFTQLTIWNAEGGQVVKTLPDVRKWETFSPDGRLLALPLWSFVMVWDMVASGQHYRIPREAECLAFSAVGYKLALASKTTLEIWDMYSGECIWAVAHQQTKVTSIALSADGELLAAVTSQQGIHVWGTGAKELRVPISTGRRLDHAVDGVALSSNRKLLAWIDDVQIVLRNLKDGGETYVLRDIENRHSLTNWHVLSYDAFPSELSGRATIQFERPDCSRLCTSIGDLDINADGAIIGFHGYYLDTYHGWILRGGKRMVLLPREYRGGPASIHSGQRMAIGGRGGGILFLQLV